MAIKLYSQVKFVQETYLSCISESAIFIQVKFSGLEHLDAYMNLITEFINKDYDEFDFITEFDLHKLYIIKDTDLCWYRVRVLEIKSVNEALVFFVDVGNTITAKLEDLILLEELSKPLAKFPEQVI